jgi:ribonucleoside-diphosphate reductase alpha chain
LAADAARVNASSSPAPSSELNIIATNGHANGHAAASNGHANGNGKPSTVTLSLGTTNVAFKIQEDAPSCAECGSIMVRNGSCYKCLNCGSTSGCS